ncbi:MAG: ornithine cyclodeaminase family protein [Alphaproteobacteria bacterium]
MQQGKELLYLSAADVEACRLSLADVDRAVEAMFVAKAAGRTVMKPKMGLHTPDGALFLAMIGGIEAPATAGMKWVGVASTIAHPNQPHIAGHVVVNDYTTGMPLAVMDARWITGVRTASISAVAAKRLARKDSTTIGFVACGVQARANLDAIKQYFPLKRVRCYSRRRETAEAFAAEARARGLEAQVTATAQAAVEGMDIVVTSVPVVPKPTPWLDAAWLAPGSFTSAVDLGYSWISESLGALDRVVTDDLDQAVTEKLTYPKPYHGEVAGLVAGTTMGRQSDKERTALVFAGIGLADVAVGAAVYERARAQGLGRVLRL